MKLSPGGDSFRLQIIFEMLLAQCFGIQRGAMSINMEKDKYCNEHVQWMWEQFLRYVESVKKGD